MVKRKNPTSVRLLCYELGLRILIPQDTHVGCAPLDLDSMPSPALHSAATGPLAQITCIWLGAGSSGAHALEGSLGVGEDRDPLRRRLSPCNHLQHPGEGGFLVTARIKDDYGSSAQDVLSSSSAGA